MINQRKIIWFLTTVMLCNAPFTALADSRVEGARHGEWNYENQGLEAKNSWKLIDNQWYHFDDSGKMQKGWLQINAKWYFLHTDGAMGVGWIFTNDTWYYLHPDGHMMTGWVEESGKYYYLNPESGSMLKSAYTPDGYWVDSDGSWNGENAKKTSPIKKGTGGGSGGGGGGGHSKPDIPVKPEEPGIPEEPGMPEEPNIPGEPVLPEESDTPKEVYYSYEVQFIDLESMAAIGVNAGQGLMEEEITVSHPEFEGYEVCAGQEASFNLSKDNLIVKIYYEPVLASSPSDARKVPWVVRFVEDGSNNEILKSLSGEIEEGRELTVTFPERLKGKDGYLWEALEESPWSTTVFGSGLQKYRIGYRKGDQIEQPEDPDKEAKEKLKLWSQKAAESDSLITGEPPEDMFTTQWMVSHKVENERRIRELISLIEDTEQYYFYTIGRGYDPGTFLVGDIFLNGTYSHVRMDAFRIGGILHVVEKIGIKKTFTAETCSHVYEEANNTPASCLKQGVETVQCKKCGNDETVIIPATGHQDKNYDAICDFCGERAFWQEEGDVIETTILLNEVHQTVKFVCVDQDYLGGSLYVAVDNLPVAQACDVAEYNQSSLRSWLNGVVANGISINGNLVGVQREDGDGQSDDVFLLSKEEVASYQLKLPQASNGFLTRSSAGGQLYAADNTGTVSLIAVGDSINYGLRPAIVLKKPDAGEMERHYWEVGDVQARTVNGKLYLFRCIDDDYSDAMENQEQLALFLCDSIIRSDVDSTSSSKKEISFGSNNNYKKSTIREWLNRDLSGQFGFATTYIGVNHAYTGSTKPGTYHQMDQDDLKGSAISFQLMQDTLFSLSIEEALRYQDVLWRFDGAGENNPDSQYSKWSKGYWLRTPLSYQSSNGAFWYGTEIYVVDTVNGNIHPADVSWTSIGMRPAFTMPQS